MVWINIYLVSFSCDQYRSYIKDVNPYEGDIGNSDFELFKAENPIEDNSDEDVPEELKRDFVDEEDDNVFEYGGITGTPNHTSTPAR